MMLVVFTDYSMPFYKFGDILFLEKIKTPDWVEFIKGTFERTGKSITDDICKDIVSRVQNHPYYVQQLAQQVWLRTETVATLDAVEDSHSAITAQLSLMFDAEAHLFPSIGFLFFTILHVRAEDPRGD